MAYKLRRKMYANGRMYQRGDLVPEGVKPPSTAVEVPSEKAPSIKEKPVKSVTKTHSDDEKSVPKAKAKAG